MTLPPDTNRKKLEKEIDQKKKKNRPLANKQPEFVFFLWSKGTFLGMV